MKYKIVFEIKVSTIHHLSRPQVNYYKY